MVDLLTSHPFFKRLNDDDLPENTILCIECRSIFTLEARVDIEHHLSTHQAPTRFRKAGPDDYLIKAFMRTLGTDYNEDTLIYPNFEKIYRKLVWNFLVPEALDFGINQTESVPYVSCIVKLLPTSNYHPVVVQYYEINYGIKQNVIGFTSMPDSIHVMLRQGGILEKLVGFSGDFCPIQPDLSLGNRQFKNLEPHTKRALLNLPNYEKIHHQVKKIIYGNLPFKNMGLVRTIIKELFINQKSIDPCLYNLQKECEIIMPKKNKEIFCVSFMLRNYDLIADHVNSSKYTPEHVKDLLKSEMTRFYLSWISEVDKLLEKYETKEKSGVVRFLKLSNLMKFFKKHSGEQAFLPPMAQKHLPISKLPEVTQVLTQLLSMAYGYLNAMFRCYCPELHQFSWVLPSNDFDRDQIHESYHFLLQSSTCSNCDQLESEVDKIKGIIVSLPGADFRDKNVTIFWGVVVQMFREKFRTIPIVFMDLLQFLFCIPASNDIDGGDQFMENIKSGFLGNHMVEIRAVVKD